MPLSKAEVWRIFEIASSWLERGLSLAEIDWLLADRARAEYFESVIRASTIH